MTNPTPLSIVSDSTAPTREQCYTGAADGLERAKLSFELLAQHADSLIEKRSAQLMVEQIEDLLRLTRNVRRSQR